LKSVYHRDNPIKYEQTLKEDIACRTKTEPDQEIKGTHPDKDAEKDKDRVKARANRDAREPGVEIDREAAVRAPAAARGAVMDRAKEIR
jgi:hypothetical protein